LPINHIFNKQSNLGKLSANHIYTNNAYFFIIVVEIIAIL